MPFSRKSLYALVATAAVLAVCYHASIAPPVGAEFVNGELRAVAASANQDTCADDVKIKVWDPADPQLNYNLKDPPDYSGDDEIRIYYDVHNVGCRDVSVVVELHGSQTGALIHNADPDSDHCPDGCTIAAGEQHYGNVRWDLNQHPAATDERIVATVIVTTPEDFNDADPTNDTSTSDLGINILPEGDPPADGPVVDVALTSVTPSHTSVAIGTTIEFSATVANNGSEAIAPSLALFVGPQDKPTDSANLDTIQPGESSAAVLDWNTTGSTAGTYATRVVLTLDDDASNDNDTWTTPITLRNPVVDVRLTAVNPTTTTAPVGEPVSMSVNAANHGDFAAVPIVELYIDDELAPVTAVPMASIAPDAEGTVELTWDTTALAAGNYRLKISVRPDAATVESMDSLTATAVLFDAVDVAVTSAVVANPPTILGESVTVSVTVTNAGDTDAGPVAVAMYIRGELEPIATRAIESLSVGATVSLNLIWDTAGYLSGQYNMRIAASTAWDVDASNDSRSVTLNLHNLTTMLAASTPNANGVIGDTIQLAAHVLNHGSSPIEDLTVGLYTSHDTAALTTTTIPSIAAGATEIANLDWDTAVQDAGTHHLHISVSAPGISSDVDDTSLVIVTLRNEIDLTGVRQSPNDAIVGNPVTIVATLSNVSLHPVTDATVRLVEAATDHVIFSGKVADLPSTTSTEVLLLWDTSAETAGTHRFRVVVLIPDRHVDSTDALPVNVSLREPAVNVALVGATSTRTNATVGQPVSITASVTNYGETPLPVPISLFVDHGTQPSTVVTTAVIQPGETGTGTLIWDTTGVRIGPHTLVVVADAEGDTSTGDNTLTVDATLYRSAFGPDYPADQCVDDVAVEVLDIFDDSNGLRAPLTYDSYETLTVFYQISNYSCATDVSVVLILVGSASQSIINAGADPCRSGCPVPAGGIAESEVEWSLVNHPEVASEMVKASVVVQSPADFSDADSSNDVDSSEQSINVVHPKNILVRVGSNDARRSQVTGPLLLGALLLGTSGADYAPETLDSAGAAVTGFVVAPDALVLGSSAFITGYVVNSGDTEMTIPVELRVDDGATPVDKTESTNLRTGAFQRLQLLWNIPFDLPAASHRLTLSVADPELAAPKGGTRSKTVQVSEPQPGPRIIGIYAPQQALLGTTITVRVDVQNSGATREQFPVELFLDASRTPVATATTPMIEPGATESVTLAWDSPINAPAREYLLRVRVRDKPGEMAARVSLRQPIVGVSITSFTATPSVIILGEQPEVVVTATLENTGDMAVNARVTLFGDGLVAGGGPNREMSMTPGGVRALNINLQIPPDTPARTYKILVEISAPSETNTLDNSSTVNVTVREPYTLAELLTVVVAPSPAFIGETISAYVTVINPSSNRASIPISVALEGGSAPVERRNPSVAPHESVTRKFEWHTSELPPGEHTFHATAHVNERTITAKTTVVLQMDTEIISLESNPAGTALQGQPVEILVTVRNNGRAPINIPVQLIFPSAEKSPERRSPRVQPGETAVAAFVWRTSGYPPGLHTLQAELTEPGNVTAGMTAANLHIQLTQPLIDVTIAGISASPEGAMVGALVEIAIAVSNDGAFAVNVPITLHYPSADKQPETRRPRVDPGETAIATFEWRTSRYTPGTHSFRVVIPNQNPSEPPLASQVFNLVLLPPLADFAVENITVPDIGRPFVQGEWIPVAALVRNLGPSPGRGTLKLEDATDDSHLSDMYERSITLEPGESRWVEFTWKSLRYDPGERHLRVVADGDYDPTHHNNRTQLATVALLPNEDIIIGFGDDSADALVFEDASPPALQTTGDALDQIVALDIGAHQAQTLAAPEPDSPMLAAHDPVAGRDFADTAQVVMAMHRLHRAADRSAHHCSDLQRRLGNSQPRAVLCPAAPALVR